MGNSPTPLTPDQLNYADSAPFKSIIKKALTNLRCGAPGIIQAFDPVKGATVQIAITEIVKTAKGAMPVQLPLIYNVPVVIPRGGGFSVTMPFAQGDECAVIFSDMGFDLWWARGGVQDQIEARRHDLTDAICIPGPWSQPRAIPDYSTSSMQIRSDDGNVYIELTPGDNINIFATGSVTISANGKRRLPDLLVFASNALAIIGGLVPGDLYRNTSDPSSVCVVF